MTEIVRKAWAGTLESSDVYVELEPLAGRLEINLESVVYQQFGSRILEVARKPWRLWPSESAVFL